MMKFDNIIVRRQDRLLEEQEAQQLLRESEYGVLSMVDTDGSGYGVPLNYVWNGDDVLYVHCAPQGHKLQALARNAAVSFCVVGGVKLMPASFTTEYKSVILKGTTTIDLPDDEKRHALHLLIEKLSPNDLEIGAKYIEKSFHRVKVMRITVHSYSAKRKQVKSKITY